ncbi:MAG: hypothetical protein ACOX4K_05975 [Bacillota bacterium]
MSKATSNSQVPIEPDILKAIRPLLLERRETLDAFAFSSAALAVFLGVVPDKASEIS